MLGMARASSLSVDRTAYPSGTCQVISIMAIDYVQSPFSIYVYIVIHILYIITNTHHF